MDKPTITILIGNIASGKSTWVGQNVVGEQVRIISRDSLRYMYGWGDYVFDRTIEDKIQTIVKANLEAFLYLGDNIIIDETNMSTKSRKWIFDLLKHIDCNVKAIVFKDRGEDSHVKARLGNNHGDTPEDVWRKVYRDKQQAYDEPTLSEGFTSIEVYDPGLD